MSHCRDCGLDLSGLTVNSKGRLECPTCGKTTQYETESIRSSSSHDSSSLLSPHDRYELIERIGEGSFGIVFKAYDRELHRHVAIKTPRSLDTNDRIDIFLREARAVSGLRHENIVSVYDVLQFGTSVGIVSELIEGITLRDWILKNSPSYEMACSMTETMCRAVHFAHEHGVVHRDIKPANIVVDGQGVPHLLDFGLSQSRNAQMAFSGVSKQPIGTPAFMAPEQVKGDADKIDRWTDVYALGVVLYQMLTKRLPFHGNSSELYQKILVEPPPSPRIYDSNIPTSLEAICLTALAKEPAERFASARDMADDLRRFLEGELVLALGRHDRRSLSKIARRQWVGALAAISGLGLLASSPFLFRKRPKEDSTTSFSIDFEPKTASVHFARISPEDGHPIESERIEIERLKSHSLSPGYYQVTIQNGNELLRVYRTIPHSGSRPIESSSGVPLLHRFWKIERSRIILPKVTLVPLEIIRLNMSLQEGGTLRPIKAGGLFSKNTYTIEPFWIDQDEVSFEAFSHVFPRFQSSLSMARGSAILGIDFEQALAYAERVGKQIPTAWQWLWVATNGGKTRFPWGDEVEEQPWPYSNESQTDFDLNGSEPPVKRLFSNVLEWADTPPAMMPPQLAPFVKDSPYQIEPLRQRAIVGGPKQFSNPDRILNNESNPMHFGFFQTTRTFDNVGFRCVREIVSP